LQHDNVFLLFTDQGQKYDVKQKAPDISARGSHEKNVKLLSGQQKASKNMIIPFK
jgi:hypothetical protein